MQALDLRPEKGAFLLDAAELNLQLKEPGAAREMCKRALHAKSDSVDPGRRTRLAEQAEKDVKELGAAAAPHLSGEAFVQRFGCTRDAFGALLEYKRRLLLASGESPVVSGAAGESLKRKVEHIRKQLSIGNGGMADVVREANQMLLGGPATGTLIEQVQALLVILGEAAVDEAAAGDTAGTRSTGAHGRTRAHTSLRTLVAGSSAPPADGGAAEGGEAPNKFSILSIRSLALASAEDAAHGLDAALGLDDKTLLGNLLKAGQESIENEFLSSGNSEDKANLLYVNEGRARKTHLPEHVVLEIKRGRYHGGPIVEADFDAGHDGMTLDDFVAHEFCQIAGLQRVHVLALRLYTTSSYRRITGPLRERERPHPFRMTVYYLAEAIKKLRAVAARLHAADFQQDVVLWRGMRDTILTNEFKERGGAELAPMSTSREKTVALTYADSTCPLVFQYVTKGMDRPGVSLDFLSVYPNEREYVYPPMTYLQYVGQHVEGDVTVVQVMPRIG